MPRRAPAGGSIGTTFAVHELYLGDTDFDGKADTSAWAYLGANIDGKVTTCASTNVCTLERSASPSVQVDGAGGIDNSFGANLWPLFNDGFTGSTRAVNRAIASGETTLLLNVTGLDSSPTQTATGLSAQAFLSAPGTLGGSPWSTADQRQLLDDLLIGQGPPFESTEGFPDAYVVEGTWVSGPPGELTVPLVVQRVPLVLLVHHAVVTFQHATPTHAANGIISGILSKTEIEASFRRWVGGTFPSLCSGSTLDPILSQIRSNQDILSDGTNEPGVPCDAFSLGIGFTADEIAPPTAIAPTACPKPNPCAKDASVPACDGG